MGVVVTGSAGGLGAAIHERITAETHEVIGVDVRDAEIVADLSTAGGRAEILGALPDALDGFVACAGLGPTAASEAIISVNAFGAIELLDGCVERLTRGALRAAVAVSSNTAPMAGPECEALVDAALAADEPGARRLAAEMDPALVYAASKQALTRAVRRRVPVWGEAGVRLNAVAPGPVRTPLLEATLAHEVYGPAAREFPVPLGRWGTPEDVAAAVWFLLSTRASWVHGSVLFVDGGTDALLRPDAL